MTFRKIYLELIFWDFSFKIQTGFYNASTFLWQGFAHKKVLIFILRCFQSYISLDDLEKSYIHVSDNASQIGKAITNPNTEIR